MDIEEWHKLQCCFFGQEKSSISSDLVINKTALDLTKLWNLMSQKMSICGCDARLYKRDPQNDPVTFAICSSHFQSVAGTTTTVALVFRLLSAPVTAWQLDNWRSECLGRSEAPSEKEFRDLEMVGIVITFRVFIP